MSCDGGSISALVEFGGKLGSDTVQTDSTKENSQSATT